MNAPSPTLELSVVVPTYRRPAMLTRCLEAILSQDLDPRRYEIIVCDDGPDDATRAAVATLAVIHEPRGATLRYVPVTGTQGPAGARNAGWRAARSSVIAFTDDDTIATPQWLSAGLSALNAEAAEEIAPLSEVSAVTGAVEVPFDVPRHPGDAPTDYEVDASGLARAEFVTANCFVRRDVLLRLNGFDERYTSAWREDSDLQFRILDAGGTIKRSPQARIVHPVRPARWGISISQQKKSQFDALLYKMHPDRYRSQIRAAPPWNYYAIVAGAVLGIVCWLAVLGNRVNETPAHHPVLVGLGAAGFLVWAVLTLRFAAMRLAHTSRAPSHVAEMVWTSILIPPLSIYWRLYGAVKFKVAFL